MNFFEHQQQARRTTWLLVLSFIAAMFAVVVVINLACLLVLMWLDATLQSPRQWLTHPATLWVSLITLGIMLGGSLRKTWQLRHGGEALARLLGAQRLSPDHNSAMHQRLRNVVEEMSIASGIPAPQLFVLPDEAGINALVAGFRPAETILVITRGALEHLTRDQLQGVVAHEFSHIVNADMRLNLRLLAILAGLVALGKVGEYLLAGGHDHRTRRHGAFILAGLLLVAVGYCGLFCGRLIKAAISRQRERLADASAVQFTRHTAGLAGALICIRNQHGSHLVNRHAEDLRHMCFSNTLELRFGRRWLASHPPLDERLNALGQGWAARARVRARQQRPAATADFPATSSAFAGASPTGDIPTLSQQTPPAPSQQVGAVHQDDLGYARTLLTLIPAELHEKRRHPQGARQILLALFLANSRGDLAAYCRQAALDARSLLPLAEQVHRLGSRLRLPLIDLALPTVKAAGTQQRQALLEELQTLDQLDPHPTLFKWALLTLARERLQERAGDNRPTRFYRYGAVAADLQLLLSLLTWASGARDGAAPALFRRASHGLLPKGRVLLPLSQCSGEPLERAVSRLQRLSPLLKAPVLDAAADLVLADDKIQVAEAELLRTLAALLETPLPPLFNRTR